MIFTILEQHQKTIERLWHQNHRLSYDLIFTWSKSSHRQFLALTEEGSPPQRHPKAERDWWVAKTKPYPLRWNIRKYGHHLNSNFEERIYWIWMAPACSSDLWTFNENLTFLFWASNQSSTNISICSLETTENRLRRGGLSEDRVGAHAPTCGSTFKDTTIRSLGWVRIGFPN